MPARAVSSPTASTRTRMVESVDDRAGHDPVARALGHRPGLAGDHRLVELGLRPRRPAVGRHPAAGAHEHDIAGGADRRSAPVSTAPSSATRSASSGSSSARAASAPWAWPMAFISCQWPEQHDRDQRGQLPPEVERRASPSSVATDAPKATSSAREISSIIPGWRALSSAQPPSRKTRPPMEEDGGAEDRGDPVAARERGRRVAEVVLDHPGPDHHRDGEGTRFSQKSRRNRSTWSPWSWPPWSAWSSCPRVRPPSPGLDQYPEGV